MKNKDKFNATLSCDAYKTSHRQMYPDGTTFVYSNMTARGTKYSPIGKEAHNEKVVFFGLSYVIQKYIIEFWNEGFFNRDVDEVVNEYAEFMKSYIGHENVSVEHLRSLHAYGKMPVKIKALKEGSRVPIQVPFFTIENTVPEFFWVTNYLETLLSAELWKPITSATTANGYRQSLEHWADITGSDKDFIPFQGHDFSFRGMSGFQDACVSGMAHLTSFVGSDTLPAVGYADKYYNANETCELTACSVVASEHSVSSVSIVDIQEALDADGQYKGYKVSDYPRVGAANQEIAEYLMMKRYLTEVFPTGIVSLVGDTYDYFRTLEDILPVLKDDILARDGKYVSRPDSGIPVQIICGIDIEDFTNECSLEELEYYASQYTFNSVLNNAVHGEMGDYEVSEIFKHGDKYYKVTTSIEWNRHDKQYYYPDGIYATKIEPVELSAEQRGAIDIMWDVFGGTINSDGYKVLDPHVGLIYGDSINYQTCNEMCRRLEKKGYASQNIVLGFGSYGYQYVTRDSYAMAVKATYAIVNGRHREIFKDPKTGSGKKSAKGLLAVLVDDNGNYILRDKIPYDEYVKGVEGCQFETVFEDGVHLIKPTLGEIRKRIARS